MSFLVISDEEKARAHELALYAARPENWYRPSCPGDGDKHTLQLGSYRCVFTYTVDESEQRLVRHLSISVRASATGRYPSPIAAYTIAGLFGFTGGVEDPQAPGLGVIVDAGWDWCCGPLDTPIPHVVLAQVVGPVSLSTCPAA